MLLEQLDRGFGGAVGGGAGGLEAGRVVGDPGPFEELAVAVDHGDVVVVARPVEPAEHSYGCLSRLSFDVCLRRSKTDAEAHGSLMEGLWARHPIGRS
ncbi:hypothetical protein [Kitasatospora sp. NPDC094016]|uniref:hypothetical protein n=1 Tax=Kitasatospora sp. NPDC094016 TaxID=3154986 RepID=UPI003332B717